MMTVLNSVDGIINRIAQENHLPLEGSKHEKLVLKDKKRKKKVEVKWVKWLEIILDESLTLEKTLEVPHSQSASHVRPIQWNRQLTVGVSTSNWRKIYTGMIRAVALWAAELGWRGQQDWEEEMEKL